MDVDTSEVCGDLVTSLGVYACLQSRQHGPLLDILAFAH